MSAATDLASQDRWLLRAQVEEFLYAEADLLDDRRFEEWLELFAEDARYAMPLRHNVAFEDWTRENSRPGQDICWFDEDKATLRKRVQQLATGVHWAEEPVSRVSHLVTNVRVVEVEHASLVATSRFLVYRNHLNDETDVFIGRRRDVLRPRGGSFEIASREILLEQSVLLAKNLTLFF